MNFHLFLVQRPVEFVFYEAYLFMAGVACVGGWVMLLLFFYSFFFFCFIGFKVLRSGNGCSVMGGVLSILPNAF